MSNQEKLDQEYRDTFQSIANLYDLLKRKNNGENLVLLNAARDHAESSVTALRNFAD